MNSNSQENNAENAKSFFEYLAIADMERIHSQFLAWVLSEDCKAINKEGRENLLEKFFGVNEEIKNIQTEWEERLSKT